MVELKGLRDEEATLIAQYQGMDAVAERMAEVMVQ
jgi:hypothetical protein